MLEAHPSRFENVHQKNLEEWREYYFDNLGSKEHIYWTWETAFIKITEVIHAEVAEITEQDSIDYMIQQVIDRIYDGYVTQS